ncbi:molybdenum cofactor guanylyltransferase [Sandarakinorhabdus sp.]|uniref:molybdenum cofactor guanylyltransferase n=1 Tax=Sandarakinorhabdus sp. TaxID=1916663 RepID=UPI003F6F436E
MTRVLGAILAGGQSRRFGSDKALALYHGLELICHVINRLQPQCDALLICGRRFDDLDMADDRPEPGLGPLGGLAAALHAGRERQFDMVVSVPCDTPDIPEDLVVQLGAAPAFLIDLPVIGAWPCALSSALDAHLAGTDRRSMQAWARRCGAAPRHLAQRLANLNTHADLMACSAHDD